MMDMQELYRAGQGIRLSEDAKQRILSGCAVRPKPRVLWKYVAAAACAVLLLGVAALWQRSPDTAQGKSGNNHSYRGVKDTVEPWTWEPDTARTEDIPQTSLPADEIHINECGETLVVSDCARYYDPELYEDVAFTEAEMEAYFGRELGIEPLPEGLQPDPRGVGSRFVKDRATGEWVYDVLEMSFWNDWGAWESDGAQRMVWEGGKGAHITMSRTGIQRCCILVFDEDMIPSTISGQEVTIGRRTFGTCYDENHEPQFEYPVYVANFTMDGVEYEVFSENLEEEAFLQILRVLIGNPT